jgi:hypothetical protein
MNALEFDFVLELVRDFLDPVLINCAPCRPNYLKQRRVRLSRFCVVTEPRCVRCRFCDFDGVTSCDWIVPS